MKEVMIVGATRTPIGSFRGALSPLSAVELGAVAVRRLLEESQLPAGEIDELISEATAAFANVLDVLVIDQQNDPNAIGTAKRLAKMYINELMEGRYYPAPDITPFPNQHTGKETGFGGMLVVRSEIKSMCSHHHQIVDGVAYIGIIPKGKVIGLSKYTRLAQHLARRGTLQEEQIGRAHV